MPAAPADAPPQSIGSAQPASSSTSSSADDEFSLLSATDTALPPTNFPSSLPTLPLGADCRSLFHLRSGTTFLNHGSYGAVPRLVQDYHCQLLRRVETHPDLFFRCHSFPLVRQAVRSYAALIGAEEQDVVFVTNATSAVNAVLSSLCLTAGDVVVTPDLTYNACKLAMQAACERAGAQYLEFSIPLPVASADDVVKAVSAFLSSHQHLRIRFALFDIITSPTALVMPYAAVCALCRQRGIVSMLDAAHAVGQLPLSVSDCNADYLTTNCHKWCYAPKGSALLWSHRTQSARLYPTITSHHHRHDELARRFWQQGTRSDDTVFIAAAAALVFYSSLGMGRVQQYNTELADWAVDYLSQQWSVQPYPLYPREVSSPFMRVLQLPALTVPTTDGNEWMLKLMADSDVVVAAFVYEGQMFVRFSCQLYNEKADYERLAAAVNVMRVKE